MGSFHAYKEAAFADFSGIINQSFRFCAEPPCNKRPFSPSAASSNNFISFSLSLLRRFEFFNAHQQFTGLGALLLADHTRRRKLIHDARRAVKPI